MSFRAFTTSSIVQSNMFYQPSMWSMTRLVARRSMLTISAASRYRRRALRIPARRGTNLKKHFLLTTSKQTTPTMQEALAMPLTVQEMDNSTLVTLGEMGHHEARIEILKRHIMARDQTSYEAAGEKFKEIARKNSENKFLLTLPYHVGIATALTLGAASLPMVFSLDVAHWFNTHFVTTQIPEPEDVETIWEVGSYTWNWMEPPLGTISFVLLTLQFSRSQIQNLGAKPYTEWIKQWRARRLAQAFPQYEASVVMNYSHSACLHGSNE